MSKKILFLTGKRGGFGAMLPTLNAIREHPDLELSVYPCDQHLQEKFGRTVEEVNDSFPLVIGRGGEYTTASGRLHYMGDLLGSLTDFLVRRKTEGIPYDILLLIGDRLESLIGAIAAHNLGIPIAHVQAGDITGGVDNAQRWAISHMSTWLFAGNQDALDRLHDIFYTNDTATAKPRMQMQYIDFVGDVHIDRLMQEAGSSVTIEQPYIVLLQHPDTLQPDNSAKQLGQTLIALRRFEKEYGIVAIYPCSDQGHHPMIEMLEAEKHHWTVHKNLPHGEFITLLEHASCLVGNSSCGIIEAPYLNTPVVNIGDRQRGRQACGSTYWTRHDAAEIEAMVHHALHPLGVRRRPATLPYGDGTAYKKIVEVLANA